MAVPLLRAFIEKKTAGRSILCDQAHRAVHDGVGEIALPRQRRIVARRPPRPPAGLEGQHLRRARGLGFGCAEEIFEIEHFVLPDP